MTKRVLCFTLVLCMAICNLTFAAEVTKSGVCGENLTWTLDANGVLTISGTGDMTNYPKATEPDFDTGIMGKDRMPVSKIVIEEGVTSIGDNAFARTIFMKEAVIPNSVTTIGKAAFQGCSIYAL